MRIVIYTGSVEVEHLAVERFLAAADIADAVEKLFPVVAAACAFEALIVHREAFDDGLTKACGCPLAKFGCGR